MKTFYINGKIYTMNNHEIIEAMIVDRGIIQSVGTTEEVMQYANKQSNVIDLQGQVVIPGLNDSHLHVLQTAVSMDYIDLSDANSVEDIIEIGKKALETHNPDKWLLGKNWNQTTFPVPEIFTKDDLDKISTEIPIAFTRVCIHTTVLNSKAIELLNKRYNILDITHPDYKDFRLGILHETNQNMFRDFITPSDKEELKPLMLKMNHEFASKGITSVISDDFSCYMSLDYNHVIDAYRDLYSQNQLTYKVCQKCALFNIDNLNKFLDQGYNTKQDFGNYRIGPLKLYMDGSLGSRTAFIKGGYADAKTDGIANYTYEELLELVTKADANGMQIAIHGIGDGATSLILQAYETLDNSQYINRQRHGVIHAQVTTPDLVDSIINNNVLVYAQPIFVASDQHILADRIGKEKEDSSYVFKTMIDRGGKVAFSSDAPVERLNPFYDIYCAVTRKDPYNLDLPAYKPDQCIDIYTVIKAYTEMGAYFSFEENKKGTLQSGKVADFIIIDRDIFEIDSELIRDTKVLQTYVDGNLVYSLG